MQRRLAVSEIFGIAPLSLRAREAWMALRGDGKVPATQFDVSSLGVLRPWLSLTTWAGKRRQDRKIPLSNLVNRTPTPIEEGWSVRKSQVRDFRGGRLTYDSHNGTDFAIPVGTTVVAAAPGRVLRISSEFHRGGLKIFIDHGQGLFTTSNHLGRALIGVGELVDRGQAIALSGYSGLDGVAAFPWSVPHVHYNVWHAGRTADPFAAPGETPLWLEGNTPAPFERGSETSEAYEPTVWKEQAVSAAIAACRDEDTRQRLAAEPSLPFRGMNTLVEQNYFPTRFSERIDMFESHHERSGRLSLPFSGQDFDGVMFPD